MDDVVLPAVAIAGSAVVRLVVGEFGQRFYFVIRTFSA